MGRLYIFSPRGGHRRLDAADGRLTRALAASRRCNTGEDSGRNTEPRRYHDRRSPDASSREHKRTDRLASKSARVVARTRARRGAQPSRGGREGGTAPHEAHPTGGNSGGRARRGGQGSEGATGGAKPQREVRGAQAERRRTPPRGARRSGAEQETPPEAPPPKTHQGARRGSALCARQPANLKTPAVVRERAIGRYPRQPAAVNTAECERQPNRESEPSAVIRGNLPRSIRPSASDSLVAGASVRALGAATCRGQLARQRTTALVLSYQPRQKGKANRGSEHGAR